MSHKLSRDRPRGGLVPPAAAGRWPVSVEAISRVEAYWDGCSYAL